MNKLHSLRIAVSPSSANRGGRRLGVALGVGALLLLFALQLLPFSLQFRNAGSPAHCGDSTTSADVIVVGAGLSGLAAARAVLAANKTVILLEARDRVGGRVENQELHNGGITELGAAFVGPTQNRVLALAEELKIETFPEYNSEMDAESSSQLNRALADLNRMAATIDVNNPWNHKNATELDSISFAAWLDKSITARDARFLFDISTNALLSANAEELSFLYVLRYIAAAGNETLSGTFERLITVVEGGQKQRLVGGTGLLATRAAAEIGHEKILLGCPVLSIEQHHTSGGPTVKHSQGSLTASKVIVAMSPPLAARITYEPPLPAMRDQLTQRMYMGALGKATAIYASPFWRKAGFSGQVLSDIGYARTTFDVSPPDDSYGAMLGFIEADEMRLLDGATEEEVQVLIKQDYERYFGSEAANVTEWAIKRWDTEVFSRGGPVAVAGPGQMSKYGAALTAPVGDIHWAGTEAASYWTGYMDGAIRAGEQAAKNVLAEL